MKKSRKQRFKENRNRTSEQREKNWVRYRRRGEKQIAKRGYCQVPKFASIHPSFDPRSGALKLMVGLDEHGHVWQFFTKDKAKMTPAVWVKLTTRGKDATGTAKLPQWTPDLYDRTNPE